MSLNENESENSIKGDKSVERFLKKAIEKSNKVECVKAILFNDRSKMVFFKFLKEDYFKSIHQFEVKSCICQFFIVIVIYLFISQCVQEVLNKRERLGGQALTKKELVPDEELIEYHEMVDNIAKYALPSFLRSKSYSSWRAEEKGNVYSFSAHRRSNQVAPSPSTLFPVSTSTMTRVEAAMGNMAPSEVDKLLSTSSWLSFLISGMETIPIAFTLASADSRTWGFPLIYVNRQFELETGYSRSEIIGQNCRFLQPDLVAEDGGESEMAKKAAIGKALSEGRSIAIEVINAKKTGERYLNLLVMKPIFDQFGACRYYVGLCVDIASDISSSITRQTSVVQSVTVSDSDVLKSCEFDYLQMLVELLPDEINCDELGCPLFNEHYTIISNKGSAVLAVEAEVPDHVSNSPNGGVLSRLINFVRVLSFRCSS
jgi:PAS domain S-box-containing protein